MDALVTASAVAIGKQNTVLEQQLAIYLEVSDAVALLVLDVEHGCVLGEEQVDVIWQPCRRLVAGCPLPTYLDLRIVNAPLHDSAPVRFRMAQDAQTQNPLYVLQRADVPELLDPKPPKNLRTTICHPVPPCAGRWSLCPCARVANPSCSIACKHQFAKSSLLERLGDPADGGTVSEDSSGRASLTAKKAAPAANRVYRGCAKGVPRRALSVYERCTEAGAKRATGIPGQAVVVSHRHLPLTSDPWMKAKLSATGAD